MSGFAAEHGLTTRRFTIEVTVHADQVEGQHHTAVADDLLDWLCNLDEELPSWLFSFDVVDQVTQ